MKNSRICQIFLYFSLENRITLPCRDSYSATAVLLIPLPPPPIVCSLLSPFTSPFIVPPLPYHSSKITPSVIPLSRHPRQINSQKGGTGHRFCSLSSPKAALTSTKRGSHPHTSTHKDIARTRLSQERPFLYSTRRG